MKRINYIIVFLLFTNFVKGQNLLTKDEALKITLEQNYDIKVTEKELDIAENNASIQNSDYLPTVALNGRLNYSNRNITADNQEGAGSETNKITSSSYNTSIGVNYVLFDGLNRKYSFEKLKETYNLTELQARQVVENTLLRLYFSYYEVARLTENEQNQKESLEISKRRLLRSEFSSNYGQSTKLDVLNAEVDVNNDSINYLDGKRQLINAKRNLNVVLGREATIVDYDVETDITYLLNLNIDDLMTHALDNNVLLMQLNKGIDLSNLDVKINKSGWVPRVDALGSYGFNHTESNNSFTLINQNYYGLGAGLSLGWNIFDGGKTSVRVQNSKIQVESQKIEKEQFTQELKKDVHNAWEFYQNALFKMQVQEMNVETNKRNFERTNEQYKLGQINSIDFRLAQVNLLNAEQSLSQSKYDAKNAEFQLLYLAGGLLNY